MKSQSNKKEMILVSACLAGINCAYDGKSRRCEAVEKLIAEGRALPVCPEQLGGLPTPRIPAEKVGDRVVNRDGADVTDNFMYGAAEAMKIVKLAGVTSAILKARSPSCGFGEIYDGTFTNELIPGDGIFTALLKTNGIEVITEKDL